MVSFRRPPARRLARTSPWAAWFAPLAKSGGFSTDPDAAFWRAFFAYPELHLPVGIWQFDAALTTFVGSCGDDFHQLTASVVVRVEP